MTTITEEQTTTSPRSRVLQHVRTSSLAFADAQALAEGERMDVRLIDVDRTDRQNS